MKGTESKIYKIKLTIKERAKDGGDLETTRSIGSNDEVSLKKARKIGRKWRKWARKGIDPKEREDKDRRRSRNLLNLCLNEMLALEATTVNAEIEELAHSMDLPSDRHQKSKQN